VFDEERRTLDLILVLLVFLDRSRPRQHDFVDTAALIRAIRSAAISGGMMLA
jgi:hypothetical protein